MSDERFNSSDEITNPFDKGLYSRVDITNLYDEVFNSPERILYSYDEVLYSSDRVLYSPDGILYLPDGKANPLEIVFGNWNKIRFK